MNQDDLLKLQKTGESHPSGSTAKICPACLGPLVLVTREDDGDTPVHDPVCWKCSRKQQALLTPQELAEYRWKGIACNSCRHLTRMLRTQYCMDCYLDTSKKCGKGPDLHILDLNLYYTPVTKDRWIEAEVERILLEKK